MNSPQVNPARTVGMVNNLFVTDPKSNVDKWLSRICAVTGFIAFSFKGADFIFDIPNQFVRVLLVVLAASSAVIFIFTLCILGIKTAGRLNGKKTFLGQLLFTLSRVVLFLFLPCLAITLLAIWIAYATGHLALAPSY